MTAQQLPNVSRETNERLEVYVALLRKWNPSINLDSKASLENLWSRHILDSAQIYNMVPQTVEHWVDLGSGGGFPGLVIAIMSMERKTSGKFTLVESDARKCTFLRTVIRETGVDAKVLNNRIEEIPPLEADIVSARALADLSTLLHYAERHMRPGGAALFPKGETWQKELRNAQSAWRFQYEFAKSETEAGPVILRITGVSRV